MKCAYDVYAAKKTGRFESYIRLVLKHDSAEFTPLKEGA
ncbi:minor capsid protein 2 [Salmonella phage 19]|nr:minor capsid protein 2 [Salmonella phage 19]